MPQIEKRTLHDFSTSVGSSVAILLVRSGKLNPADVTTKALDKAVTVAHVEGASGDQIEHSQLGSIFQTSKILNC